MKLCCVATGFVPCLLSKPCSFQLACPVVVPVHNLYRVAFSSRSKIHVHVFSKRLQRETLFWYFNPSMVGPVHCVVLGWLQQSVQTFGEKTRKCRSPAAQGHVLHPVPDEAIISMPCGPHDAGLIHRLLVWATTACPTPSTIEGSWHCVEGPPVFCVLHTRPRRRDG